MGIATTTAVIDHTGDAGFRAWVAEFITLLTTAGAVQTSDTGQINTATVTRPGTNTNGGYAIFRDPGSNLYWRFDFGTETVATRPRIQRTTGTGSNGSGTITGQTDNATQTITSSAGPLSTVLTYVSAVCCKTGYLGISWKENAAAANISLGFFVSGRSVNSSQALTTDGFGSVRLGGGNLFAQAVRTASPASAATEVSLNSSPYAMTCIAGAVSSSVDSAGNNQAYLWQFGLKDVQPFLWACTVLSAEVAAGATFSVALIGSTPHTYRACPSGSAVSPVTVANYASAIMWE